MRVSRRIKEREHAVEKMRHTDTNELRQHQDLVGMKDGKCLLVVDITLYTTKRL